MKELLRRHMQGRNILLLFTAATLVYVIMVAITIPRVMSFAGGMKPFDMMPTGYSVEYAGALLAALGEDGRSAYLYTQLPLDFAYPFLFGISYCLIAAFVIDKLGKFDSALLFVCALPLLAGAFDYFENIGIIMMLTRYPVTSPCLAQTTNVCTIVKSSLTILYFSGLLILIIVLGLRTLSSRAVR